MEVNLVKTDGQWLVDDFTFAGEPSPDEEQ